LNTSVPLSALNTVWPSGSALAAIPAPMLVAPPGRFSITTGWPSFGAMASPRIRARVSVPPPAA
jgi:hypothetical protein